MDQNPALLTALGQLVLDGILVKGGRGPDCRMQQKGWSSETLQTICMMQMKLLCLQEHGAVMSG